MRCCELQPLRLHRGGASAALCCAAGPALACGRCAAWQRARLRAGLLLLALEQSQQSHTRHLDDLRNEAEPQAAGKSVSCLPAGTDVMLLATCMQSKARAAPQSPVHIDGASAHGWNQHAHAEGYKARSVPCLACNLGAASCTSSRPTANRTGLLTRCIKSRRQWAAMLTPLRCARSERFPAAARSLPARRMAPSPCGQCAGLMSGQLRRAPDACTHTHAPVGAAHGITVPICCPLGTHYVPICCLLLPQRRACCP